MAKKIKFEEITLRIKVSERGGGVEIDLTRYGFKDQQMSAYQNSLGGGMLGKVGINDTIRTCTHKQRVKLGKIGEELKRYYFDLTNPDSEWERQTYEQNQTMPISAY
jgi:hypothetical protein